jgi:hypothetical protein
LAVKASYTVSKILAKKMKPFADGEMIKECLTAVAEIAFSDKKDIISKISLSRFTIGRRIEDMSENITATLGERIQKFEWCSLALDESCDISDKSQLAIFVRGIDSNFNITEELGSLIPMKGTTTGKDLYNELKSMLENLSIPLDKIVGISTDGAPAMASMNVGVAGTLFNDIKNLTGSEKTVCSFNIFSSPFNIDVETVPDELQMELIDLQNDTDLRNKFQNVDMHSFYQKYISLEKFPRLGAHAKQIMTLFGSTYVCEQLFSAMKIIKSDHRSRLNDVRLESCVRVAVSSISANIDQLMIKKQCQISH